jgi:uncharacterized DUF497 family protein
MKFEWDREKEKINIKKHGISFSDAKTVFNDPLQLSIPDEFHSENEERWITVGMMKERKVVVVVHNYRDMKNEEIIRIISARSATPKEKRQYMNG